MLRKPALLLGLLALVLSAAIPLFAQDSASEATSSNQEYSLQPDASTFESLNAEPAKEAAEDKEVPVKLVTAIEVKGNKSISTNVVISKMKSKVGSPYQDNVVSDDVKRLYLLGFFSDIKMDTQDYKDGMKIIITVTERPLIEKITFSGIRRLTMKDDKLKEQLKSKETQYLDYPNLAEDVRTLKKLYEKKGYTEVDITYNVDINKETGKAKVQFNVAEGKKVSIKDIIIEGNKNIPKNRILKIMKTKRAWLFNAGILKDDVLKEDMERIKTFYRKEGFSDVAVDYDVQRDPKKPFEYVHIRVQEGKKYLVGNVGIKGNKDITQKVLLSQLKECLPGKVFSQDAMQEDLNSIHAAYFNRGYISAQVQEITSLNPDTGRVDITYNIVENDITYVGKIKVRGNVKTKDVVVRRELRIKPGERFDGDKLKRSKERLQNLGFFEEISYDTEETSVPDKKDLVVDVKEAKTGAFSFGGGYSTVDQFIGFVEIEQKNFDWRNFPYFTGGGQDLKMRFALGTVSEGYDLSYTNPWVFDYPVSFGFDAYKQKHDRESDTGYGYDEDVTGGDLRLGKELTEYVKGGITYRFDSIKISNVDQNATSDLTKEVGKNSISSLQFDLSYDSRDNVFDPTRGDMLSGSYQQAGGPLGGNKDYYKFFGRASHYVPLFRGSALEFRGRLGFSEPYSNSDSVPIYERFFAGGTYTVRGYDERKVGPVDPVTKDPLGGQSMFVGNVEYTYPVFSFMKLAGFFDIGNVWPKAGEIFSSKESFGVINSGGLKKSFGLGVRLRTPIGPIILDYGIPLDKASGEDSKSSGKVHFSVSHDF